MFNNIFYFVRIIKFILQRFIEPVVPIFEKRKDPINARNRDLRIREIQKYNWRADIILFFAYIGTILPILMILFLKHELKDEELVICSTMVSIFGSIITDAALFEFGNNSNRQDSRKK